jgi:hypothetical protein
MLAKATAIKVPEACHQCAIQPPDLNIHALQAAAHHPAG